MFHDAFVIPDFFLMIFHYILFQSLRTLNCSYMAIARMTICIDLRKLCSEGRVCEEDAKVALTVAEESELC